MGASLCNTALFHEDHFIKISQVLETKIGTTPVLVQIHLNTQTLVHPFSLGGVEPSGGHLAVSRDWFGCYNYREEYHCHLVGRD